jgi:histidine triad (HIT) family protein
MSNNCVFCKIINGEIPAERLYDDDNVTVILDIAPANKGHALVILKKHYARMNEVPEEEMHAAISVVKMVSHGLIEALKAEGVNVHINDGRAAGPQVSHTHIHVIPRFMDDGLTNLSLEFDAKKYAEPNEKKEYADKIRKAIR